MKRPTFGEVAHEYLDGHPNLVDHLCICCGEPETHPLHAATGQKPEWHPDRPGWAARTLSSDHPLSILLYRHGLISAEFTPGWTECACGWRADPENPGWHRLHVAYEVEQHAVPREGEADGDEKQRIAALLVQHFPHGYACGGLNDAPPCDHPMNSPQGWADHVAALLATPPQEPERLCDHPGIDHDVPGSYCWPCPRCGVCKFIGHGPLCIDCATHSAQVGDPA